ncbi:MAG: 2-oxo-4-hydroxy-4-carboxy-5-ureidoimidazoline decarboxylase [Inquilinus sp.]|nr:2-oxo-4-hydroxy-4-carboxy-5-ureidoimidazoline decarboxylase [Inquilinus sp.]
MTATEPKRFPLSALNAMPAARFVEALGEVYEHSPWVARRAAVGRPFSSIGVLHDVMVAAVRAAGPEAQDELIRAHPDLAGKAARARDLTDASTSEQAGAGLDSLTDDEYERFDRLNRAYREKFDFPFIIAVKGLTKNDILRAFEQRIGHDEETERQTALDQIARIARFRLNALIVEELSAETPETLPEPRQGFAMGRLTTHVLDTANGRPAAGLKIHLIRLEPDGGGHPLKTVITNADGRADQPLLEGAAMVAGAYELLFEAGAYFRELEIDLPDPPFLDEIPIRFAIADAGAHYHVPLLVSPWSYSTYRGS